MSFIQRKVRFMEYFKDGMILEGREFKPEEEVVLDDMDVQKIVQSGGVLTDLGGVIPNPQKPVETAPKSSGKKNDSKN